MHKKVIVLLPILVAVNMVPLFSQTIVTDRPDQTESSIAIPKGAFQIETGILIERSEGFFSVTEVSHPSTLFRYGLCQNLEIRLVHAFNSIKTTSIYSDYKQSGMADIELGAKFQFVGHENSTTKMAVLSHVVTPSGSTDFSNNIYSINSRLLVSHHFSKFDLGYNLGFNYSEYGHYFYSYTLSFSKPINDKLNVYVEPFGETDLNDIPSLNLGAGLAYLLTERMQVDFAFGTGIDEEMNFLTLGFSILFTKEE